MQKDKRFFMRVRLVLLDIGLCLLIIFLIMLSMVLSALGVREGNQILSWFGF